ncbi:MAG: hypothetical protein M3436_10255 [Pseudomonadota bacterium]|nr:hypothetical protein [Pseudomonadota bacterium]
MSNTRLARWAAFAGLVTALIGAQLTTVAMASNASTADTATGVQIYTGVSATRLSEARKHATAVCPDGKRVLGGGARVVRVLGGSTNGKVFVNSARPTSTLTSGGFVDRYHAAAVELAIGFGYADDWYLVAYAVCGDPMEGLRIVSRGSDELSSTQPFVRKSQVSCPSGTKVIGTGGSISGGVNEGRVSLRQIRPNQQGAYVFVEGIAYPGYQTDFEVWAYAVCAKAPLGWHVAIDGNDFSFAQVQRTSVACPSGEQALGAGFTKGDNQGLSNIEYFFPSTSRVYLGGGARLPPQPWNIAAWAVCVTR